MAHIEITVPDPDLAAVLALTIAIVAIDLWAIRQRRSTISRWYAHQLREHPVIVLTLTGTMLAHLTGRWADPFRLLGYQIERVL